MTNDITPGSSILGKPSRVPLPFGQSTEPQIAPAQAALEKGNRRVDFASLMVPEEAVAPTVHKRQPDNSAESEHSEVDADAPQEGQSADRSANLLPDAQKRPKDQIAKTLPHSARNNTIPAQITDPQENSKQPVGDIENQAVLFEPARPTHGAVEKDGDNTNSFPPLSRRVRPTTETAITQSIKAQKMMPLDQKRANGAEEQVVSGIDAHSSQRVQQPNEQDFPDQSGQKLNSNTSEMQLDRDVPLPSPAEPAHPKAERSPLEPVQHSNPLRSQNPYVEQTTEATESRLAVPMSHVAPELSTPEKSAPINMQATAHAEPVQMPQAAGESQSGTRSEIMSTLAQGDAALETHPAIAVTTAAVMPSPTQMASQPNTGNEASPAALSAFQHHTSADGIRSPAQSGSGVISVNSPTGLTPDEPTPIGHLPQEGRQAGTPEIAIRAAQQQASPAQTIQNVKTAQAIASRVKPPVSSLEPEATRTRKAWKTDPASDHEFSSIKPQVSPSLGQAGPTPGQAKVTGSASTASAVAAKAALTKSVGAETVQSFILEGEMQDFLSWDAPRPTSTSGNIPLLARTDLPPQIARQLVEVMGQAINRPVEITLSPEELGRVRISVQNEDGRITVNILAERFDTLDLMRRHIDQLGQTFRSMGYDSITFAFGQGTNADNQSGFTESGSGNGAENSKAETAPSTEPVSHLVQLDHAPTTGLDIRL